jgi:hypothetical protein
MTSSGAQRDPSGWSERLGAALRHRLPEQHTGYPRHRLEAGGGRRGRRCARCLLRRGNDGAVRLATRHMFCHRGAPTALLHGCLIDGSFVAAGTMSPAAHPGGRPRAGVEHRRRRLRCGWQLVERAVRTVRLTVSGIDGLDGDDPGRILAFGRQLDARTVRTGRRTDDPDRASPRGRWPPSFAK